MRKKLHAVADPQHRNAKFQQAHVQRGSILFPDAGGAAGKNDCIRFQSSNLCCRCHTGMNFGIDARLAHTTRDELGHLRAVVYNDDF